MNRPEIHSLTGLRAVAALWVLGYHLRPPLRELFSGCPARFLADGYLGVDIFFVLSGFILALNYGGRIRSPRDYGTFVGYRVARIYPLHLFTLLGLLILAESSGLLGFGVNDPQRFALDYHLPLHLLMIHAWGFEESLRFNLPSWSISAEFFAYLLFPLVWWLACRTDRRTTLGLAAAACAFGSVLVLRTAFGYPDLHVATHHALVRVSGAFLAGVLVYRLFALRRETSPPSPWIAAAGLGIVVAVAWSPLADWLMPLAASLLIYLLACGGGPVARPLESGPFLWLGRISFSIYLVHLPVFSLLGRILPREPEMDGMLKAGVLGVYVLTAIATAAACYYTIEVPFRHRVRRWVDARGHAAPATPSPDSVAR